MPPRVFKSHLPIKYLPDDIDDKAKIVYVLRNPKDIIVSIYNFLIKSGKRDRFDGSLDDYVDNFINGKTWYGAWWSHVDSYIRRPNVFVVKYEEMIEVFQFNLI